jgi:phosphatidylserine decarboxylase
MAGFELVRRKVIEGALLTVNEKALKTKSKVYEQNSRLILHGKWKEGYLAMVLVGALNVGRIVVKDKVLFDKGEEIGYFNLGSTIVLLIESPDIDWKIA